ncbi:MAG: pyocin knob domain-containing protein [Culicoidibacterales bacterium]
MADLQLGSQIGGNLIWHQGNLELVQGKHLYYKTAQLISDVGGQTINGALTLIGRVTADSVLVSGLQVDAANALTRKDYVDSHINDFAHINKPRLLGTVDLNTLSAESQTGFYKQNDSSLSTLARNYPIAAAGYLTVRMFDAYALQEYVVYNTSQRFSRAKNADGTWTVWKETIDSQNEQTIFAKKHFVGTGALARFNRSSVNGTNYVEFGGQDAEETRIGYIGNPNGGSDVAMHFHSDRGDVRIGASANVHITSGGVVAVSNPVSASVQQNRDDALTRKDYVDSLINNIGNTAVTLATNQTITGHKIFARNGGSDGTMQVARAGAGTNNFVAFFDEHNKRQGLIGQTGTSENIADMQFRAEQNGSISITTADGNVNISPSGGGKFTNIKYPRAATNQEDTGAALTRKDYVDTLDAQNVKITGNQTINGVKTFGGDMQFNGVLRNSAKTTQGLTFNSSGTSRIGGSGVGSIHLRPMGIDIAGDTIIYDFRTDGDLRLPAQGGHVSSATRRDFVDTLDKQNVKITGNQNINGVKNFHGSGAILNINRNAIGQDNYIAFGGSGEARMGYIGNTSPSDIPHMRIHADRGDFYVGARDHVRIEPSGDTLMIRPRSLTPQVMNADALTRKDYVDAHINDNQHLDKAQPLEQNNLNDLNTIAYTGYYIQTGDVNATPERNYPIQLSGFLTIKCISAQYVTQIYETFEGGYRFTRMFTAGAWSSWSSMINDNQAQDIFATKRFVTAGYNAIEVNRMDANHANLIAFNNRATGNSMGYIGSSEAGDAPAFRVHSKRADLILHAEQSNVYIAGHNGGGQVAIENPVSVHAQSGAGNALVRFDYLTSNFPQMGVLNNYNMNAGQTGIYRINEPSYGPPGVNYSQMISSFIQDTGMQIVLNYSDGNQWTRTYGPGGFTNWRRVFTTNEVIPVEHIPGAPRDYAGGRGGFYWGYDGTSLFLYA